MWKQDQRLSPLESATWPIKRRHACDHEVNKAAARGRLLLLLLVLVGCLRYLLLPVALALPLPLPLLLLMRARWPSSPHKSPKATKAPEPVVETSLATLDFKASVGSAHAYRNGCYNQHRSYVKQRNSDEHYGATGAPLTQRIIVLMHAPIRPCGQINVSMA